MSLTKLLKMKTTVSEIKTKQNETKTLDQSGSTLDKLDQKRQVNLKKKQQKLKMKIKKQHNFEKIRSQSIGCRTTSNGLIYVQLELLWQKNVPKYSN